MRIKELRIRRCGTAARQLIRSNVSERTGDARFEAREVLEQCELSGDMVERLVDAFGRTDSATLKERRHFTAEHVHKHERLAYALRGDAKRSLVRLDHRSRSADEQTRRLGFKRIRAVVKMFQSLIGESLPLAFSKRLLETTHTRIPRKYTGNLKGSLDPFARPNRFFKCGVGIAQRKRKKLADGCFVTPR